MCIHYWATCFYFTQTGQVANWLAFLPSPLLTVAARQSALPSLPWRNSSWMLNIQRFWVFKWRTLCLSDKKAFIKTRNEGLWSNFLHWPSPGTQMRLLRMRADVAIRGRSAAEGADYLKGQYTHRFYFIFLKSYSYLYWFKKVQYCNL